jgi:tRNA (guanine-N7-)-methyltransferase
MARMRKTSRLWREDARAAAANVMVQRDREYFSVEPSQMFGREAPLELEIGAGRGDFIIERAASMPERDFLAVELAAQVAALMAVRAGRRGLRNLRVARMDARPLVNLMLAPHSLAACHIYFPDPWRKERHLKHRLFAPYFARSLACVLRPDAPLYVATDVRGYADAIFPMLAEAGFARVEGPVPGASATGFARKFIAEGREVFAGAFIARAR